jgi:hypothetical protein
MMSFKNSQYPVILTLTVLNLFGLVLFLPKSNSVLFIKEFYFLITILLFVAIGLFSVANGIVLGWFLFAVFFAVNMFNEFYIYSFNYANTLLFIILILIGLFGFIFSLSSLIKKTKQVKKARKAKHKKHRIAKVKLDSHKLQKPLVVYESSSKPYAVKKKTSKAVKKKVSKSKIGTKLKRKRSK